MAGPDALSVAVSLACSRRWHYDGAAVWSGAMVALVGRLIRAWNALANRSSCRVSLARARFPPGVVGRWFSVRMEAR